MTNEDQLKRLRESAAESNKCVAWNQWRWNDEWQTNIDFKSVDLSHTNLNYADLSYIDLSYADLSHADLGGTILNHSDLRSANLSGSYLGSTDLSHADLSHANLSGAVFSATLLSGARIMGATMSKTILGNLDLRGVVELAEVDHHGPSYMATSTLYTSHGEIPDSFLRGCGLPDELISFVHALSGAIQYYSAFISYNHEDEAFATRLYNDLQANNVRCWKYTEDMKIGDLILSRVDEAIRLHDKLLVIFSEHAVQSSWVAGEVETALEREKKTGRQVLFPVTIDNVVKETHLGWAADVRRTRNIGDFRAWKNQDQYQPKFKRLLRDLKQASSA